MSSAEIFELAFFFCARASFKCRSWRFGLVGFGWVAVCDGLVVGVGVSCGWVGSLFRFEGFVSSVSFRMCRNRTGPIRMCRLKCVFFKCVVSSAPVSVLVCRRLRRR